MKKSAEKKSNKIKGASPFIISKYFGFDGLEVPEVTKDDITASETFKKVDPDFLADVIPPVEEQVAFLRAYKEWSEDSKNRGANMVYYEGQAKGAHKKKSIKSKEEVHSLHIIGTPKTIAEALLIKAALSILEDRGYKNVSVHINSIGDKDTIRKFTKEITSHLRNNIEDMNTKCRELFKKGPHSAVVCGNLPESIVDTAPDPLSYLTDECCDHLKEVVEYLEKQNIPYQINKTLLGNPHYAQDTIFSIIDDDEGKIVATGSRYNMLAKAAGFKKHMPGASIRIKVTPKGRMSKALTTYDVPIFFLVHIGIAAKTKSLEVLNILQKAKISVDHGLIKDSLASQMQAAERKDATHLLIIGHKEALDNTILIRDVKTHTQHTVPIEELVKHLKKIK